MTFHASCLPKMTFHVTCLFSLKNREKIKLSSAVVLIMVLKVNEATILIPKNPKQASEISTLCMHMFIKTSARFTVGSFAVPFIQNCLFCFFLFMFLFVLFSIYLLCVFFLFVFGFILLRTSVWLIYSCIKKCIYQP